MLAIYTTDRALEHLVCFVIFYVSVRLRQPRYRVCVVSRCKLQRKPFSFRANAVLFLLVDKTIVWELSTREIGLSAAEKYSFAERRNTVWQRGDIQFSRAEKYRLLRGWSRWAGLLG